MISVEVVGETTNDFEGVGVGTLLTERIIGCAMRVHNALGAGFLEKVYENALMHELRKEGMHVHQQVPIKVTYDGVIVGDYVTDLIVEA